MKIRWLKEASGIYKTDTGRFRAWKEHGKWYLNDTVKALMFRADSLREAKQLADDQLDYEATS